MKPQRYKKRGTNTEVEAIQLTEDNASEISNWANGAQIVEERDALSNEILEGLNVKTPAGKRRASRGMYVIKHNGLFYASLPERFEQTYRAIDEVELPTVHVVTETPVEVVTDPFEGMTRFGEGPKP